MTYSVTNSPIKAGEDKKLTKMTKRTIYVVVAVATAVKRVQQGKSLTEPASRRLWPSPACFQVKKSQIIIPGLVSMQGPSPSPHCNLSPRVQMMAKASKRSAIIPVNQISHK
jgi:hypothetical protein